MPNLNDYYTNLLNWEGVAPIPLVHAWPAQLRQSVEADIVSAVALPGVKGSNCPLRLGSASQSIGNQVEDYIIPPIEQHTSVFKMGRCSGVGYPDKTLTEHSTGLKMSLEVKVTSDWNPADSHRRVLTSSSTKLRRQFTAPIHHLLLTVLYTKASTSVTIDAIRLDFLEPSTIVSVRLEASVNHKILSNGSHHKKVI